MWWPHGPAGTKHEVGPQSSPVPAAAVQGGTEGAVDAGSPDPTKAPGYCGSCYGAQSKEGQCCNTCAEVRGPQRACVCIVLAGCAARRSPACSPAAAASTPGRGCPLCMHPPMGAALRYRCCTAVQVRDAYRTKGWALLDIDKVEQCHHEG